MTFQPGQSGNPAGRQKKSLEHKSLEELARCESPEALRTLVRLHKNRKIPASARVAASIAILDRGYGKPTQPIESDVHLTNYGIADHEPTKAEWDTDYAAETAH